VNPDTLNHPPTPTPAPAALDDAHDAERRATHATDRWERLESIFDRALALPAAERSAWLNGACEGDASLRAEIEAMLCVHEGAGGGRDPLESPALPGVASRVLDALAGDTIDDLAAGRPDPFIGRTIGRFAVLRRLAHGGMGVVYEARQERPHRTVALKVMRRHILSRAAIRRFQYEADVLARLHHPNIAQVYDAGVHDEGDGGIPWFAMEFVREARPITDFADARSLDTRDRIALMIKVCDAVHHGHQNGVIHRDLKPSNILVDAEGGPKVIDFGVARSTDSDVAVTTQRTDVGQVIGTMRYMSPEQCDGDPRKIDTRCDVYALGVVLYELLTDRLPYDVGSTIVAGSRVIRETEPHRPSCINRKLKGSIESVMLKALAKDRERRYASADAFKRDLDRVLKGEPTEARGVNVVKRFGRVIGRHPLVTLSAAGVMIVAGTIAATSFSVWWTARRPDHLDSSADRRSLVLNTVAGVGLKSWPHASSEARSTYGNIPANRSSTGRRLGFFTLFHGSQPDNERRGVALFPLDAWDDPDAWLEDQIEEADLPDIVARYPDLAGRVYARGFGARTALAADVFDESPGDEIIAAHIHGESICVLRIYSQQMEVLFEAWHYGHLESILWLPTEKRLVLAGLNVEARWQQRTGIVVDRGHPIILTMIDVDCRGPMKRWIETPDNAGEIKPHWYVAMHPEPTADHLGDNRLWPATGSDPLNTAFTFDVVLRSEIFNAESELGPISWHFTIDGEVVGLAEGLGIGRRESETFKNNRQKAPAWMRAWTREEGGIWFGPLTRIMPQDFNTDPATEG